MVGLAVAVVATLAACGPDNGPSIDDGGGGGGGGGDTATDAGDIGGDDTTGGTEEDGGDTTGQDTSGDDPDGEGDGGGECEVDCTPGDTRCTDDGESQTCVPGGGGCGRWGQASECGDDQFCHDNSGLCEDEADFPCQFQDVCSSKANCTKDSEAEDGYTCDCFGNYVDYHGDGSVCFPDYFTAIDSGNFQMGSPDGESGRDDDEQQHQVEITHSLAVQKYEATQASWGEFIGNTKPWDDVSDCTETVCPVFYVNWWDALRFANAMSEEHELDACYDLQGCSGTPGEDFTCNDVAFEGVDCEGWRLPTEAEWEYAARAGTSTATYNGDLSDGSASEIVGPIAWYQDNAGGKTHEWGGKEANDWGLHDVSGNVAEWVWDGYASYPTGSQTDPTGDDTASDRVVRGGHWNSAADACRSAARAQTSPDTRNDKIGFRVVRTLPSQ